MNNLPQIHDIYVPENVSIFPLAYGWWVILFAIIGFVFLIKFILWSISTSKKIYALNRLKKITIDEPINAAIMMSELLRRICAVKYEEAQSLYGQQWIDFLNSHCSIKLSTGAAQLLIYAPFMNKNDSLYGSNVAAELKSFCKQWIGANL